MELKDKQCVIVGASGSIGTAVAAAFRREGANLMLTYHSVPSPEWKAMVGPGEVQTMRLDVSSPEATADLIRATTERFGRIDVLVNCAGILGPLGLTHLNSTSAWSKTIEINLMGPFYLLQAVVPVMQAQGGGKIIFFSGGGAAYGRPNFSAYSVSKTALVRLTENVAEELSPYNIQVNAIAPGAIKSRMWEELRAAGSAAGEKGVADLRQMDETGGVQASRPAELALFLASQRSGRLSGRLVSAVHDDWKSIDSGRATEIVGTEAWTLRRVPLG